MTFMSVFSNLIAIAAERNIVNKEGASGLYHVSAYYVAKSIQFFLPSLFFNVAYWFSVLQLLPDDLGLFFVLWLLMLLIVTTGCSAGSFLGIYQFGSTGWVIFLLLIMGSTLPCSWFSQKM